ncbi:hypothetical protein OPIT5_06420 [Opitutaceae bacterium TAV5]|nr:hypothetical protein OPIT5_06420 [Opitutaceae bacterium TAV5]
MVCDKTASLLLDRRTQPFLRRPDSQHSRYPCDPCLAGGGKIIEIELLDHVIIGDPEADPNGVGYHSFHEAGLM